MAFDPNAAATKWAGNLANAANTGAVAAGVARVTVAPGQAAARQKAVWAANVAAAQDRWATNVGAVSLPSWQQAMTEKAVPRIAQGAAGAESKMASFLTKLAPVINNAVQSAPQRGSFQQNLQRANYVATQLHNAKGSFK